MNFIFLNSMYYFYFTFCNLQHSDKVTIVPLKEKVYRSLAIAWDKNKLLTEDEQNFLEYTKKWFDSL